MCSSRIYSILSLTNSKGLEFPGSGQGICKTKIFIEMMKCNWNFREMGEVNQYFLELRMICQSCSLTSKTNHLNRSRETIENM